MTPMVEFVDAIIAYEELRNREVISVRLGTKVYMDLKREISPYCVNVKRPTNYPLDMEIRGVRVWCDPTMPEDAGEAIVVRR